MGSEAQGAAATAGRWLTINRTLVLITQGDSLLLMRRALTRRVFPGYYNGIGGHLERDEDPVVCALRETREETGLNVHNMRLRGVTNIDAGGATGILLFIFTAEADTRETTPCDEGELVWVPLDQVDGLKLVEDLPLILPRLFGPAASDAPFFAHVGYDSTDHMIIRFAEGP